MTFNADAFSHGQITSKLWLCQELEKLKWSSINTHVYGGWHGILSFLLLSREQFQVERIESFDIDASCEHIANLINENWLRQGKFKAYSEDCNMPMLGNPDLIINTSTEHFSSLDWFDKIPKGTRVALQGNNMPHDDHVVHSNSLTDFANQFKLADVAYSGSKDFKYPTWSFTRYMIIGTR
jgi:hypothetical protein